MSQTLLPGYLTQIPWIYGNNAAGATTSTLDAAGETCHMFGEIVLENPEGGSKTISAAGGGKIVWRAGVITFANAGSTFDIGIQDMTAATAPGQGDGVFDVKASLTGGGGGITASATNTTTMAVGTKTITHGQEVAITLAMTARAGVDSVIVSLGVGNALVGSCSYPAVTDNTTGVYATVSSVLPNAQIIFDDGTTGWFFGATYNAGSTATVTFNSSTATADEYGTLLNYPVPFKALGVNLLCSPAGATSDFEILLYSDPLGTPTVQRTITVDVTKAGITGTSRRMTRSFTEPFLMLPNTSYAIAVRPTTTSNVSLTYYDNDNVLAGKAGAPNSRAYAVRRLDNAGAFTDWNGGVVNTRLPIMTLLGSYIGQDSNFANSQIGI